MALKAVLTKAAFAKLDENLKALYVEDDGAYRLDVEGSDDTAKQLADTTKALDAARREAKESRTELAKLRAEREEADLDSQSKAGKADEIRKSYEKKIADITAKHTGEITKMRETISRSMIEAEVSRISGEVFINGTVGRPFVASRLTVDFEGEDGPAIRVLDSSGKPSAMKLDELRNELLTNKDLSAIVKASQASGGAAPNRSNGVATGQADSTPKLADLDKLSMDQKVERYREQAAASQKL